MTMTRTYWLVPVDPTAVLSTARWTSAQRMLLEMEPARTVDLVGDPPHAIRIVGYGQQVDVALAVLRHVEDCVGTALRYLAEAPVR